MPEHDADRVESPQPRGAGVRLTLYLYSLGFLTAAVLVLLLLHGD